MESAHDPNNSRTVVELIRELRDETSELVRQEIDLAKTELAEKAKCVGRNSAIALGGALFAYAGLVVILVGLSALVASGLEEAGMSLGVAAWLGPVIVGVIAALIGLGLVNKGVNAISSGSLKPDKTVQSLKEDKEWTMRKMKRA